MKKFNIVKFYIIACVALLLSFGSSFATSSFPDITAVAGDAVTLVASLIAIGVTILAWKLGSRWIKGIVK